MAFSSSKELVEDFKQGKMVILVDSVQRENEGDLVIAAQHITFEHVNFMITHARGLLCAPLSAERARALNLKLMCPDNESHYRTAFTISLGARHGITTGISAPDRAHTLRCLADKNATPHDFVSPGHVFPLIAREGGLLERQGHTEAAVDLARLSNLTPVCAVCEILKEDGTMARRDDLFVFAKIHHIKIGTIDDLAHYRAHCTPPLS